MANYFVVHRRLSKIPSDQVTDWLEEILSMATVDDMTLLSSFTYTDAANVQHLYMIFDSQPLTLNEEIVRSGKKESKQKGRKT